MQMSGNTILVTGGCSGIGLALAKRFLQAGNKMILVDRNEEKLKTVQQEHPETITRYCDVSDEKQRIELFEWVTKEHPDMNVLLNVAGIMRPINLADAPEDWCSYNTEIEINMVAPIHLTMLFVPHLIQKKDPAIIIVSSRLGIMAAAWVPIYSATKAGLHLYARSLRLQLQYRGVKVVEILPAIVSTEISGFTGTPVDEFADGVMKKIATGDDEIGYGVSEVALTDAYTQSVMQEEAQQRWLSVAKASPEFANLL